MLLVDLLPCGGLEGSAKATERYKESANVSKSPEHMVEVQFRGPNEAHKLRPYEKNVGMSREKNRH